MDKNIGNVLKRRPAMIAINERTTIITRYMVIAAAIAECTK